MTGELAWGRRYLMCQPENFDVSYAINPWMDLAAPVDKRRALAQWDALVDVVQAAGATVETIMSEPGQPDMVYAMNYALVDGPEVLLGRFRHDERAAETDAAEKWFADNGYVVKRSADAGLGAFEPGDGFLFGDALVLAHGPRTDVAMHAVVADALNVRILPVRTVDERLYHLDLSFCPLDEQRALVAPHAWDEPSAARVMAAVPEPLVLTPQEVATFCANSIVIGRRVIMPACSPRVAKQLAAWGFDVEVVDVSELHKGGGSIRCMTLPLDTDFTPARLLSG